MGADRCVNAADEDLRAIVADMTGGAGVDVGVEYSGSVALTDRAPEGSVLG